MESKENRNRLNEMLPKKWQKNEIAQKNGKNGKWAYIIWPYFYSCVTIKKCPIICNLILDF